MSTWPKYNPERHRRVHDPRVMDCSCSEEFYCSEDQPCPCCETARADGAEELNRALTARLIEAVPASYVALKERALRAEAAVERVRELHESTDIPCECCCETCDACEHEMPCPTVQALDGTP